MAFFFFGQQPARGSCVRLKADPFALPSGVIAAGLGHEAAIAGLRSLPDYEVYGVLPA